MPFDAPRQATLSLLQALLAGGRCATRGVALRQIARLLKFHQKMGIKKRRPSYCWPAFFVGLIERADDDVIEENIGKGSCANAYQTITAVLGWDAQFDHIDQGSVHTKAQCIAV